MEEFTLFFFFFCKHVFSLIYKENILHCSPPLSDLAGPLHSHFLPWGFSQLHLTDDYFFLIFTASFFRNKSSGCHKRSQATMTQDEQ